MKRIFAIALFLASLYKNAYASDESMVQDRCEPSPLIFLDQALASIAFSSWDFVSPKARATEVREAPAQPSDQTPSSKTFLQKAQKIFWEFHAHEVVEWENPIEVNAKKLWKEWTITYLIEQEFFWHGPPENYSVLATDGLSECAGIFGYSIFDMKIVDSFMWHQFHSQIGKPKTAARLAVAEALKLEIGTSIKRFVIFSVSAAEIGYAENLIAILKKKLNAQDLRTLLVKRVGLSSMIATAHGLIIENIQENYRQNVFLTWQEISDLTKNQPTIVYFSTLLGRAA